MELTRKKVLFTGLVLVLLTGCSTEVRADRNADQIAFAAVNSDLVGVPGSTENVLRNIPFVASGESSKIWQVSSVRLRNGTVLPVVDIQKGSETNFGTIGTISIELNSFSGEFEEIALGDSERFHPIGRISFRTVAASNEPALQPTDEYPVLLDELDQLFLTVEGVGNQTSKLLGFSLGSGKIGEFSWAGCLDEEGEISTDRIISSESCRIQSRYLKVNKQGKLWQFNPVIETSIGQKKTETVLPVIQVGFGSFDDTQLAELEKEMSDF